MLLSARISIIVAQSYTNVDNWLWNDNCRVQVQKTKAREAEIVLPWEKTGSSEIPSGDNAKQVAGHTKDIAGLGFNTSKANYYGRLDPKVNRIANTPPVTDIKKLQTSPATNAVRNIFLSFFKKFRFQVSVGQLLMTLFNFRRPKRIA